MEKVPAWYYDEMNIPGINYSQPDEVAAYDEMHEKLRDHTRVNEEIIRRLSLNSDSTVIDLGCGTGAFALHAAASCRTIYALEVSTAMLEYCRKQAEHKGITNIVFCQGGLLSYEHQGEPADAAVCVAVLHHLPDFWKQIALTRCYGMLKPGEGFFYLISSFPRK